MFKKFNELDYLLVIVIIVGISLFTFFFQYMSTYTPTKTNVNIDTYMTQEELEMVDKVNEFREQNGKSKLEVDKKLQDVAILKCEDLCEDYYFEHTSPKYGSIFDLMKVNNIRYTSAGENLAGNLDVDKAFQAWINSPTHLSNILDNYTYTAVAIGEDETYGKVFVQLFINK